MPPTPPSSAATSPIPTKAGSRPSVAPRGGEIGARTERSGPGGSSQAAAGAARRRPPQRLARACSFGGTLRMRRAPERGRGSRRAAPAAAHRRTPFPRPTSRGSTDRDGGTYGREDDQPHGTSTNSIEDAVGLAVTRASATIDGIRQAEIAGITAMVEDGTVNAWKVKRAGHVRGAGAAARVTLRRRRQSVARSPTASWRCSCRSR